MTRAAKNFLICLGGGILLVICVCLIISAFSSGSATGESKTYQIDGEVLNLEVEIGAADFSIKVGEKFSVESNLKRLTVRQRGDNLVVKESTFGHKNYNNAFLIIYIPEGTQFGDVEISTGAGKFTADLLFARSLSLEFGAGEVNIGELVATREAEIESGAGQLTIGGGAINNLQLEMGMGKLNLTAEIGDGELNLGVGEANITLLGDRAGYTLELNKGIGDLTFDGESLSGGRTVGSGASFVEINGGIGAINVNFE